MLIAEPAGLLYCDWTLIACRQQQWCRGWKAVTEHGAQRGLAAEPFQTTGTLSLDRKPAPQTQQRQRQVTFCCSVWLVFPTVVSVLLPCIPSCHRFLLRASTAPTHHHQSIRPTVLRPSLKPRPKLVRPRHHAALPRAHTLWIDATLLRRSRQPLVASPASSRSAPSAWGEWRRWDRLRRPHHHREPCAAACGPGRSSASAVAP